MIIFMFVNLVLVNLFIFYDLYYDYYYGWLRYICKDMVYEEILIDGKF